MKNVRFLVWINETLSTLELKPGQSLAHNSSGYHDEGWGSESTSWTYDEESGSVVRVWVIDGSDCDGRMTRTGIDSCPVDQLDFGGETKEGDKVPNWQTVNRRQRDYFAEAMGY